MRCPNSVACGKCARPHRTAECVSEVSKCAVCGWNHPVTHPDCIEWKGGSNHLRPCGNQLVCQSVLGFWDFVRGESSW
ncbi:uncharacterized protein BDW43DRAFT_262716 [Aspergillus alliaceus]|uniref:uncharacterized protein n=1 Tax=Petromyces alliaceus TaxID=209559 RepID=UPI0012A50C74|nr:uncharacterized protein BDW43DRAFT_262716 [Aspergillus alliaceus]KAB8237958.1 hypothetical protein BDW43DRAFT_262716 [Aspergillus alliaceus]